MRKLFMIAAASLLAVPAFASISDSKTLTLTIDAYSTVEVQLDAFAALHLNKTPGSTQKLTDSTGGTVYSATNNDNGADVSIAVATTAKGIPAATTLADWAPGGWYGGKNAIVAYFDGSPKTQKLVLSGTGGGFGFDHLSSGDAFTVEARLGSDWYLAPPTVGPDNVTVTATLSNQ